MGRLFYLMGKSASGKDSLCGELKKRFAGRLRTVLLYTTRPIRDGEAEGETYHFITNEQFEAFKAAGKVIESRTYQTVHGPWTYATLDDGQIDLSSDSYLVVGTLESYAQMQQYLGRDALVPLYVEVDDGLRLERALKRERQQAHPKYAELCRRFLADEADFSEEKLAALDIVRRYRNTDLAACADELSETIEEALR